MCNIKTKKVQSQSIESCKNKLLCAFAHIENVKQIPKGVRHDIK